jgi:hypothetical protein
MIGVAPAAPGPRRAAGALLAAIAGLGGLGALGGLAACATGKTDAPIANRGQRGPTSEVRGIDWQNHTYVLDELGAVTVKAGHAELRISDDRKAIEAGSARGSYRVEPPLFADVDGDGVEDAIISSVLSTGGTGQFSDIRIYTIRGAKLVELGTIPGGDRGDGGIRRVGIDGNAVIVERNALGAGEGVCCARRAQRERWVWRNGAMAEDR